MDQTPPADRRPLVIAGPSGVGKGTLAKKLLAAYPNTFVETVSHTSRKPRVGEIEGKHYFFVSAAEFTSLVDQNAFVETATFSGNFYGTSKMTITNQTEKGLVVLLDIEMEGVKQIKEDPSIDARYVFIKPPSFETLGQRLRSRATENEEETKQRLERAKIELDYADTSDAFDKIIVNDDLEKAYQELEELVFKPPKK